VGAFTTCASEPFRRCDGDTVGGVASVRWLLPVAVVAVGCGDASNEGAVVPGLDGTDADIAITAPPLPTTLPPAAVVAEDDADASNDDRAAAPTTTGNLAATTTAVPTTSPADEVGPAEAAIEPEPDVFVRRGDTGPDVVSLQQRLIAVGYLEPGGETGVFDDATADALIDFQAQYGLVVDGIFGPESDRALNAAVASIES